MLAEAQTTVSVEIVNEAVGEEGVHWLFPMPGKRHKKATHKNTFPNKFILRISY
jgi:hypothetical protein